MNRNHTGEMGRPKHLMVGALLGTLMVFSSGAAANMDDIDGIHKDLKVVSGMLQAAMEPTRRGDMTVRISSQFLANQGVVFTLSSRGDSFGFVVPDINFNFQFDDFVEGVFEHGFNHHDMIELDGDLDDAIEEIMDSYRDHGNLHRFDRDAAKRLREQQSKFRESRRSYERTMEELDRKMSRLDREIERLEDKGQSTDKVQAEMESLRQQFQSERSEYRKKREAEQKALRKTMEEREAKRLERIRGVTQETLSTLCRYGSPLKNIKGTRYVTLVVKNAANKSDKRRDHYYVFDNKDFASCVDGNIDAEKLLSRATSYAF